MGFSWSLFLAQHINLGKTEEALGEGAQAVTDDADTMVFEGTDALGYFVYVDNIGVLGLEPGRVDAALDKVVVQLEVAGIKTHERIPATVEIEMLGLVHKKRRVLRVVTISDRRFWKIRDGLTWLLSRRRVSGKQLEILIGHCTWIALLRREVLAIFHAVYKFVRRYGDAFAPLWSACRE